ncbi:MAG TPA: nucleoside diphosphate kinase regulator [Tepidisphaeraceae bacterium]|nr:nucleoside diphosphate kinase regulator [Tepidisphaeraceae bacterium]
MRSRTVTPKASRVLTDADFDRLRHLVGSPRYRTSGPVPLAPLRGELRRGTVVAPARVPGDVVTMRSRVRVREPLRKESATYTVVYPDEADFDAGRLSVLAPLGTALIGAREGEAVEFDAPGGRRRLEVVKVLYQPEAAGDFHL